ncbi:MAG: hypothetical protein RJA77_1070 [Pseudomonadota bacterium]|jgi:hypothetical protein
MRTMALLLSFIFWLSSTAHGYSFPERNPYLLDSENNQGHWNDAATDSTRWPLKLGHFQVKNVSDLEFKPNEALGIPFYSRRYPSGEDVSWFFTGYRLQRILDDQGRQTVVDDIALVQPPTGYQAVRPAERIEQGRVIESLLEQGDEEGLSRYLLSTSNRLSSAVEDQVRGGILYSMVDVQGGFIGTSARGIIRVPLRTPDEPRSQFGVPIRMQFPSSFFDDERVARATIFPKDVVFGLGMTFNGYIVVSTLGGRVITLDRQTLEVRSEMQLPQAGEVITNSFATSQEVGGGAVYVASNMAMYRLVILPNGEISDQAKDGAWREAYDRGVRLKRGKISDGTGATPTLMGFGPDEDQLVVITDGAAQMRLLAFWRNDPPRSVDGQPRPRLAGQIPVSFGFTSDVIQSEQSVAVYGPYAFVINNIMPEDARPLPTGGSYLRGLLVGATRQGPRGGAMYRWNSTLSQWTLLWTKPEIMPVATVPMISGPSRVVVVNAFLSNRPKESFHLGFDLDSGKTVLSVAASLNPAFNGAFSGIKCDDQGSLWYSTMLGLIRLDVSKMAPTASPTP